MTGFSRGTAYIDHLSIWAPIYQGTERCQSVRTFQWPRQPRQLTAEHWRVWQLALDACFTQFASTEHRLRKPLGRWLQHPSGRSLWEYCHVSGRLFQRTDTQHWLVWTTPRIPRPGGGTTGFSCQGQLQELPEDTSAATVHLGPQGSATLVSYVCHGTLLPDATEEPPSTCFTLLDYHHVVHPRDRWALDNVTSADEGASLAQIIKEGNAIGVSDGSHQGHHSTAAFILTRRQKEGDPFSMVTGKTAIPGDPSEQDSYRAELGGLMAMLTTLEVLCAQHTITQGAIELGLDGEGAFKAVFESGPPKVDDKAYDLLQAIKAKINSLPLSITGRHIKGHQDEVRPAHLLT